MNGYLENTGNGIQYIYKRHLPPGDRIDLENIYLTVGHKQGFKFDGAFVAWLKAQFVDKAGFNLVIIDEAVSAPKEVVVTELAKETGVSPEVLNSETLVPVKPKTKYTADAKLIATADKPLKVTTPAMVANAPLSRARILVKHLTTKDELEETIKLLDGSEEKETIKAMVEKRLTKITGAVE